MPDNTLAARTHWRDVGPCLLDTLPEEILGLVWNYKTGLRRESDRAWKNYRTRCLRRCIVPDPEYRNDPEMAAVSARDLIREPPYGWLGLFSRVKSSS